MCLEWYHQHTRVSWMHLFLPTVRGMFCSLGWCVTGNGSWPWHRALLSWVLSREFSWLGGQQTGQATCIVRISKGWLKCFHVRRGRVATTSHALAFIISISCSSWCRSFSEALLFFLFHCTDWGGSQFWWSSIWWPLRAGWAVRLHTTTRSSSRVVFSASEADLVSTRSSSSWVCGIFVSIMYYPWHNGVGSGINGQILCLLTSKLSSAWEPGTSRFRISRLPHILVWKLGVKETHEENQRFRGRHLYQILRIAGAIRNPCKKQNQFGSERHGILTTFQSKKSRRNCTLVLFAVLFQQWNWSGSPGGLKLECWACVGLVLLTWAPVWLPTSPGTTDTPFWSTLSGYCLTSCTIGKRWSRSNVVRLKIRASWRQEKISNSLTVMQWSLRDGFLLQVTRTEVSPCCRESPPSTKGRFLTLRKSNYRWVAPRVQVFGWTETQNSECWSHDIQRACLMHIFPDWEKIDKSTDSI